MNVIKEAANVYAQQSTNSQKQENVQNTIQRSKQAFLEHEVQGFLSYPEFVYQQSTYIKKQWWLLQGVLLLSLYWLLQITKSPVYVQKCMGILSSLFTILIIPELWKNCNAMATEIEGAAYYSLRQIYAARMLVFAMVDLILLSIFFVASGITGRLTVTEMMIQFFLPFTVSCCICFRTFCSQKAVSEYLAIFFCTVWTFVWAEIILNETIYAAIKMPVWCILMLLAIAYFVYSVKKLWKGCETIWEENRIWD